MGDQTRTYATSTFAEKMAWYRPSSSLSGADVDSARSSIISPQGLGSAHADTTGLDAALILTSDEQLRSEIMHQINYYFSADNLFKDEFLRLHMDTNGWVPIQLIASFAKVARLTRDIHLILDILSSSEVVEVQGYNVRCKHDWKLWIYEVEHIYRIMRSRSIPPSLMARLKEIRLLS